MLFGFLRQTRFQVALVSMAVVCLCAFANTLEAQTTVIDNGPVPVAQPADGPIVEIVTSVAQEPAVAPAELEETAPTALTPRRQDLRFEQLPGYQRYKEIRDNGRKLQEGGRVYKIRWSRDASKIGFTLDGQKKQFNVAGNSITCLLYTSPSPRDRG